MERKELEKLDSAHGVPEHQCSVHTLAKFPKLTQACCMNEVFETLVEEDQRNVNLYIKHPREGCWGYQVGKHPKFITKGFCMIEFPRKDYSIIHGATRFILREVKWYGLLLKCSMEVIR
jgi:hypothetical protein